MNNPLIHNKANIKKEKIIVSFIFLLISITLLSIATILYINKPPVYDDSNTKIMSGHISKTVSKLGGAIIEIDYSDGNKFKINFAKSKKFDMNLFENCYYENMIITCVVDKNDTSDIKNALSVYDIRYKQDPQNNNIYLKLEDTNYSNSHFNKYFTGIGLIFLLTGIYFLVSALFYKKKNINTNE